MIVDPLTAPPDPMTQVLATFRCQEATDWGNAWVGMEPTFQTKKSVRKWSKMSAEQGGEDAYFTCSYMLKTQKKVAKAIKRKYEASRKTGIHRFCMFARVEPQSVAVHSSISSPSTDRGHHGKGR